MPYPITITPRRMTEQEKQTAKSLYPQLDVDAAWVIGNATKSYNCIAWTVGITNKWINPFETLSDFTSFYNNYGASPDNSGDIAVYKKDAEFTHGSVNLNITEGSIGTTWTSKRGSNILITHSINGLTGSAYGNIVQRYGPRPAQEQAEASDDSPAASEGSALMYNLTADELGALQRQIAAISPATRAEFDRAYNAWLQTWSQPELVESSNSRDYAGSPEFQYLVAMGSEIVPLLIDKLRYEDQFFVLQAVERLVPSELVFAPTLDNPAVLGGEQLRAEMTLRAWLQANG